MPKHTKESGGLVRSGAHGEHPYGDTGQMICLLVFLVVWILYSFCVPLFDRAQLLAVVFGTGPYCAADYRRFSVFGVIRSPSHLR